MFDWAYAGWITVAQPRQGRLRVILVRRAGRLVGVWPLVRYIRGRHAVLVPLGAESSEYPDILTESGPTDIAIGASAWRAARALADLLIVRHVRQASLLDRVIRSSRRVATRHTIPASWVSFEPHYDIDAYMARVSKHRRDGLRRKRQALSRAGRLAFTLVTEPGARAEVIDWLLERKLEWLTQKQRSNPWLQTSEYREFLHHVAGRSGPSALIQIFALHLDGTLIATSLCSMDRAWLEFYLVAHDPAWGRFSPGALLLVDCITWACAHGLRFDFRIGEEDYKSVWTNCNCNVTSFHVALTARGVAPVLLEAARLSPDFGRRILRPWRARLKARFRQPLGAR